MRLWLANRGVRDALPGAGPTVPVPATHEDVDRYVDAYRGLLLSESVLAFRLRREELVGILRSLDEDSWRLAGTHELRGIMSVLQICRDLAEHEELHERQMRDLIATLSPESRPMPPPLQT
jgi:hypothetical protein